MNETRSVNLRIRDFDVRQLLVAAAASVEIGDQSAAGAETPAEVAHLQYERAGVLVALASVKAMIE